MWPQVNGTINSDISRVYSYNMQHRQNWQERWPIPHDQMFYLSFVKLPRMRWNFQTLRKNWNETVMNNPNRWKCFFPVSWDFPQPCKECHIVISNKTNHNTIYPLRRKTSDITNNPCKNKHHPQSDESNWHPLLSLFSPQSWHWVFWLCEHPAYPQTLEWSTRRCVISPIQ